MAYLISRGRVHLSDAIHSIILVVSRYWFVVLIWYILYRIIENAYVEYRFDKNRNNEMPAGDFLGFIKVIAVEPEQENEDLLGTRYGLREDNSIGRSKSCDICIPHPTISNSHARIITMGDDFFIQDSKSRNGTFMNNNRINHKEKMRTGDIIQIGNVMLSVTLVD